MTRRSRTRGRATTTCPRISRTRRRGSGTTPRRRVGSGWVATGSDIDRIPRQQYFLRTVSQAAIDKSGSTPLAIGGLLDTVFRNLGHDQNLKQSELNALALTFRGLNPAKVQMSTLPTLPDPVRPEPRRSPSSPTRAV